MDNKQINEALAILNAVTRDLEDAYIENGGEVTDTTAGIEQTLEAQKQLLKDESVDSLGRWRKAKQDAMVTAKAEKAAADARIKSLQKTIDYIDGLANRVLVAIGVDKVKGSFYGFARYTSTKTTVNTEALDDAYLSKALIAARTAGLPEYIDIELKTTTTRLRDAGQEQFIDEAHTETVKFTKPRAIKEA